ncbi:hypothetical protein HYW53_00690 [Candidatus Giovannonibacteria bacterium]|nr:hypothetical protein [Candidatus Giovannonibacteria bacterium]
MKKSAFVAAASGQGEEYCAIVSVIIKNLERRGIDVPSRHNGSTDPVKVFLDQVGDPTKNNHNSFRDIDYQWVEEADLFVAEVSFRSVGLGGEFEHCRLKPRLGLPLTPMLALHRPGA